MATHVLTNAGLLMGGYNLSGDMSSVGLVSSAELQDDTVFGDTTRSRKGGLKMAMLNWEGLWSGGDDEVDDALFSNIGVANVPVSVAPDGLTDGDRAYLFRAIHGEYSPGATIGEMLRFSVTAEGSGGSGIVRGKVLHAGTETATGTGTGIQEGAVAAGETVYAALHVTAVSGTNPTLDATVVSDDNAGFTSATTRLTFPQQTAIGSSWQLLAGAVTDDYWRVAFTIGGTGSPSFTFTVTFGIL